MMGYLKILGVALVVLLIAKFIVRLGIKEIIGMAINVVASMIVLYLVNLSGFITIEINWLTILLIAILGLPGLVLIIIYTIAGNLQMIDLIEQKLYSLSKSKFRSNFHLRKYMIEYINDKGLDKIKEHAYDFINKRLVKYNKNKDGKQTPMKGHPVFIAQHATGTCCRKCLNKWYNIPIERDLKIEEVDDIVSIIMKGIEKE